MGSSRLFCDSHRSAAAGWHCTDCERLLCPACTAQKRAQTVHYPVCTACGGAAAPLKVHRAERSYFSRIQDAWRYPLGSAGLVTLAAAGLIIYLLSFGGRRGLAVGVAILWSYVFALIRRTANGEDNLDPPDFTDFSDVATPGFRGALATAVLWVPAALYLHFSGQPTEPPDVLSGSGESEVSAHFAGGASAHAGALLDHEAAKARRVMGEEGEHLAALESGEGFEDEEEEAREGTEGAAQEEDASATPGERAQATGAAAQAQEEGAVRPVEVARPAWKDPVLWLLVVLGILWMPVAILSSAAGGSALEMLNPLRPVGIALRIPRDYAVAVGACLVLAAAGLLLSFAGRLVTAFLPIPFIAGWAGTALGCYVPLVAGRVLGMLLYVRGAEIGYSREEDAYEPALPGAQPQGTLSAALQGPGTPGAVEAPGSEQPAEPPRRRHAPIELDEEPTPAAAAHALAMAASAPRAAAPPRVMGLQGVEPAATEAPLHAPAHGVPAPRPPQAPAAAAPASATRSAAEALQRAVQAQELAQALQLYPAASREPGAALPAACHHAVGRHAASLGQYPLAVQALRAACAAEPAGPLAASSLVLMARLLQERMGDAASAQRVYAHVVQHYAGSEAARFAQGRLSPRPG